MFTEEQFEKKKESVRQRLREELKPRMLKAEKRLEKLINKEITRLRKKAKKEGIEITPELESYWAEEAKRYRERCKLEAAEEFECAVAVIAKRELEREAHPIASKLGYITSGAWLFGK